MVCSSCRISQIFIVQLVRERRKSNVGSMENARADARYLLLMRPPTIT